MASLIRAVMSLSCLPLVYWAVRLFPCHRVSVSWPAEFSEIWSCSDPASGGITGLMAATVISVLVLLLLVVVWLPVVRSRRSSTTRVASALGENLHRAVPEDHTGLEADDLPARDHHAIRVAAARAMESRPQTQGPGPPNAPTITPEASQQAPRPVEPDTGSELRKSIAGLKTRVAMIEEALDADTLSPRDAMREWVGLLKDCNEAHNSGRLPSSVFKDLNTRLLDLFTTPSNSPPHP